MVLLLEGMGREQAPHDCGGTGSGSRQSHTIRSNPNEKPVKQEEFFAIHASMRWMAAGGWGLTGRARSSGTPDQCAPGGPA